MRKIFAMLLILMLIPLIPSTAERSRAFLRVPAVYQTPDGLLSGTLGNLTVEVEKGEGIVYFSAEPLTQIDTQGAARTAALVASYLLGIDPKSMNFYYRMESGSTVVGGPSAGAAMTVATVAAILGKQVRQDIIITGMINLDGIIGPVGGIPQKLEAAARAGAKMFLVPAGQEIVEETVPKQVRIGPLILTTVEKRKVNISELGAKLGVKVVEVSTIEDALNYMLGLRIERPSSERPEIPKEVKELLSKWVRNYLNQSEAIRGSVRSEVGKLGALSKRVINSILSDSENYSSSARDEMAKGNLYTAASYAFQSVVEADYARSLLNYALRGEDAVNELMRRVDSKLKEVGERLNSTKPQDLSGVEAIIASKARYYDAKNALKRAADLASKGSYLDSMDWGAIHYLTYAYWRADSASNWMDMMGLSQRMQVDERRVKEVASAILYEAESVISYSESLIEEIGASSSYLKEAYSNLNDANTAFSSGDYYGSIGLSTTALAYGIISIHEWFTSDPNAVEEAVKSSCYSSINALMSKGIIPVLALSYSEMASSMEGSILESIAYYELASAHAHVISLLSQVSGKQIETKSPLETTSTVERVTVTQTVKEESGIQETYLIAALILGVFLGFVVGRKSH
jgi:uncharacterized protein